MGSKRVTHRHGRPGDAGTPRGLLFPAALGALLLLAAWLSWVSWGKWGDAVIDVGREMEVPWKLAGGAVLYRDVAYNYGPLSPYLEALFLRLLGVRVATFVLSGFLAAGTGGVLVYLVARHFLGRVAALVPVAVFFLECAFQHTYMNGGFNFILPYSFPAVHSVLFALGAMLGLGCHLRTGRGAPLAWAGVLAGLTLLCKIEIATATVASLAATTLLIAPRFWIEPLRALRRTLTWGLALLAVVACGYLPLVAASSLDQVVHRNVLRTSLMDLGPGSFLLRQLGLSDPGASLGALGLSALFWVAGAFVLAWAAGRLRGAGGAGGAGRGASPPWLPLLAAGLVLVGGWFLLSFETVYRVLPLVALGTALEGARRALWRRRPETLARDAFAFALGLLAFLSLGRILFNAGTYQYGFFMALPALVLGAGVLGGLVPDWLGFDEGRRRPWVVLVLGLLLTVAARDFLESSLPKYRHKTLAIEGPHGRMRAFPGRPRYRAVRDVLGYLARTREGGGAGEGAKTLLVIPEGAGINFLAGIPNPTSYNLFTPPELNAPGVEDRLLAELRRRPVDRILVLDRQVREFGYRAPGLDYATKLMGYVAEHYRVEREFGAHPFTVRRPPYEGGAILYRWKGP